MRHKTREKIMRYFILVFLNFCFALLGFGFFFKYSKSQKNITLTYKETSDISYNVYLKENNFFDDPYLTSEYLGINNRYLITQLIDYIDINFDYNIAFDQLVNGEYYYYVKAVVEANKPNNESGNYWEKEYILYEGPTVKFNDESHYSINPKIKIDYEEYNTKLSEIMKNSNLSMDGNVKVYLIVNTKVNNSEFKEDKNISSNIKLEIPLTKSSIQLNSDIEDGNKMEVISETLSVKSNKYIACVICLVLCVIAILVLLFMIIHFIKADRRANRFKIKLKKILNTYDSIIVNVNILPDLNDFKVIKVESFEELVDAHGEVRMPINYYKRDDDKHMFILINGDILWLYTLERSNR